MLKPCEQCAKPNKRGGRLCSACHNRAYRATPEGRQHVRDANAAYQRRAAKDPIKRARRLAGEQRWRARVAAELARSRILHTVPDLDLPDMEDD